MSYVNVRQFGTTTHEWKNSLDFYEEDLGILKERLLEVAGKNTGEEAAQGIEHFQNQFEIQLKNIHDLKHSIQNTERQAVRDTQLHAGHVSLEVINQKAALAEDMKQFETTIKELRSEFNTFLSKWM